VAYDLEQPAEQSPEAQHDWAARQRALSAVQSDVDASVRKATAATDGVYTATTESSWNGTPAATIAEAIDRCAARIKAATGTGP
jgi:hypothetical protein